jgi:imidazolonepropionase-like amidohydrolase
VVIGLGTDTPVPHLSPGYSVHDELAMYVDAGIQPLDALLSATSVNARVLGRESRVGQIAAGLTADLVAIRGDPLERIDDISNVTRVIRTGQVIGPEELLDALQAPFRQALDDPITIDLADYVHRRLPAQ